MTTRITMWNEVTEGTRLPDFSEEGVARWWTHIIPDEPTPYDVGDLMHVGSRSAPPEFFNSRWKVVRIERAEEKYRAVCGPTLHLVTAERVPDARF